MTDQLVQLAEQHRYDDLFRKRLRWGGPDLAPIHLTLSDNQTVTVTNVSTYKGIRVWVCDTMPGAKREAEIDRLLSTGSTDRLVIFHGNGNGSHADEQVWRWPVRHAKGHLTSTRLARHRHRTGAPDTGFAHRLNAIQLPTDIALDATEVLTRLRKAFDVEQHNETKQASQLMATMYAAMAAAYPATFDAKRKDHEISVTLARILFLLFGDDTDMWQPDGFRDHLLLNTKSDGTDLRSRLQELFDGLNDPAGAVSAALPYVNGGIFGESITLPAVASAFRSAILEACIVDWSTISPAIFGSMFQSVRDAATRRSLGEHYTSETNILRTLGPLFLDALHDKLTEATTPHALRKLWTEVGDIRFFDPACGCGNFIIVAYRELRDIELQIMERLKDRKSSGDQLELEPTLSLRVTLDHFYGIEIDEWPARIAETAMFLINRQCDLKLKERFGEAPQRLPIQQQAAIRVGNALQLDWSAVVPRTDAVIIAGNPPFLGISERSADQTLDLQRVWGSNYHGSLDYVTGWHRKAADYFHGSPSGRFALVSTNSITQGEQVAPLFRPLLDDGWSIEFAHRPFKWVSEAPGPAGAVHCVIIGFARNPKRSRLFDYPDVGGSPIEVASGKGITPYLTDGKSVIVNPVSRPLNTAMGEVKYGNKPTDGSRDKGDKPGNKGLIVERADYDAVAADPIAKKYLHRYVGARELLHGSLRYCLWLEDATPSDLTRSAVLRARLDRVRQFRLASAAPSTKKAASTPQLFRQISHFGAPYLCIPAHVSEMRPYFLTMRLDQDVIAGNANFITKDENGFVFAIVSTKMFLTWQATVGGRLESRLRFNKLLTWNTFPLPVVSASQQADIIAAAQVVLDSRDPAASLDSMYQHMTSELTQAHQALDELVDGLYGLNYPTLLQRQDALFDQYRKMTTAAR